MLRRLRIIASSPLALVVLGLYFLTDLTCISGTGNDRYDTVVGHAIALSQMDVNRGPWGLALYECDIDGRCLVGQPAGDGSLVAPRPLASFGVARVSYSGRQLGWYARTLVAHSYTAEVGGTATLTPAQVSSIWQQAIKQWANQRPLMANVRKRLTAFAPPGTVRFTDVSVLGYLHNTLSLFMFAMLCWSLHLNIPKLYRTRTDPTKCPHCRYSTVGLTTNTCPECGKPIT